VTSVQSIRFSASASPILKFIGASSLALSMLTVAVTSTLTAAPAFAGAPLSTAVAPGYYRVMLGDFEVTALSDGTVGLDTDKLLANKPAETLKSLKKYHLSAPTETSVNAYLINTGSKLVLIDTGAAKLFGPTLGRLANSLKAAGYQPEQVDEIYITHMHGDHVGGLMDGDKLAFPNAIVRADKSESDFWLSEAAMAKAPTEAQGSFKAAMISVGPYVKAGKFKAFEGETELVPGVKARPAHGHTPGHSTYVIESKGQKLVLMGDLMHVASVQFENPSITIAFDSDSKAAMPERKKAYADAARNGYMIGFAHVSFPGLGYVRAEGKGYVWMPVNYSPVK
jgi:glyoxylase-like metal-dependent hydrolase (beta-lactamase superfamily II)